MPVARGPRIKHVCRRASVALGLEVATFTKTDGMSELTLSALTQDYLESDDEAVKIGEFLSSPGQEKMIIRHVISQVCFLI